MRVLAASGVTSDEAIAALLADSDPTVAAIMGITPADACSVANALSLRYAIQCWDVHESGKAIFWKTSVALHGLYRAEFERRDGNRDGEKRGLLRVTLLWDGRPLDVFCTQLSPTRPEADWQLVDVARELAGARGTSVLAIRSELAQLPELRGHVDAARSAPWRTIVLQSGCDVGEAARNAFGIAADPSSSAAGESESGGRTRQIRLLCSTGFAIVRVRDGGVAAGASAGRALIADLAEGGASPTRSTSGGAPLNTFEHADTSARTGTYSH